VWKICSTNELIDDLRLDEASEPTVDAGRDPAAEAEPAPTDTATEGALEVTTGTEVATEACDWTTELTTDLTPVEATEVVLEATGDLLLDLTTEATEVVREAGGLADLWEVVRDPRGTEAVFFLLGFK
jgi:hypothetical protein